MKTIDKETVSKEFGLFIREAREMKGLLQAEIAEQLGMSRAYYTHIEAGNREIYFTLAINICRVLNLDINEYTAGKVGVRLTAEPTCVWTYNAELGVLTTVVIEKTWYLGTYNTFNTMSLSETYRISGDKAADVGVSQFPAYLATIVVVEEQ